MRIQPFFTAHLPTRSITLQGRIQKLYAAGLTQMTIIATNFIAPPYCETTVEGRRELFGATFDRDVSAGRVLALLVERGDYEPARIEDFLEVLGNPDCCKEKVGPALVCIGTQFTPPGPQQEPVIPFAHIGNCLQEHILNLSESAAPWVAGVSFLVVKKA